jgi:hypothetical protein
MPWADGSELRINFRFVLAVLLGGFAAGGEYSRLHSKRFRLRAFRPVLSGSILDRTVSDVPITIIITRLLAKRLFQPPVGEEQRRDEPGKQVARVPQQGESVIAG